MAKAGNDKTLAPSTGEGWDAWGAACGFTSWAKAAESIGITVAQLVAIRKRAPRKTIRLAMDAVLTAHRRAVPAGKTGNPKPKHPRRKVIEHAPVGNGCFRYTLSCGHKTTRVGRAPRGYAIECPTDTCICYDCNAAP